ncbi:MAG: hypothetical protein QM699_01595 [Amaricoccus sp.]|uniref:hypothetical protein n=1 Tax=Amaricoccus sp. TaxID=1872485 RepID=UPI0039E325AD
MTDEQRLSRIEGKLDRLAEAMVALARVEERMVTLFRWTDSCDARVAAVEQRVAAMERQDVSRSHFFRVFDKLAWLVIGGAVAVIAKTFGFG